VDKSYLSRQAGFIEKPLWIGSRIQGQETGRYPSALLYSVVSQLIQELLSGVRSIGSTSLKSLWPRIHLSWDPRFRPLDTLGHIVLGMHRSGTSCLTHLLESAGLKTGGIVRRSNPNNLKGMFEHPGVRDVNLDILHQFSGSWDQPPEQVFVSELDPRKVRRALEEFKSVPRWLIKDPRMLLTLDAWLPHLKKYQLIGSFRHPLAVSESLHQRNNIPIDTGVRLWLHYNRRLVDYHRRSAFPLIQFGCDPDDYKENFEMLRTQLGLQECVSVASGFDPELIHHSGRNTEIQDFGNEVSEVFNYLLHHRLKASKNFDKRPITT
jgi:hypothetical protein